MDFNYEQADFVLAGHEHRGVKLRSFLQVVSVFVCLHFQVGGFAVIEGDMHVQPPGFSGKVGGEKLVVEEANRADFAVGTRGKEAAEGFVGVFRVRTKHSLEDRVFKDAEGFALGNVFPGNSFKFSVEP